MTTSDAGTSRPSPTTSGAFYLVDNWRVRTDQRDSFLNYYTHNVAKIIETFDGFVSGRLLINDPSAPLNWHVQALYEFETDAILDDFHSNFDREIQRVDAELSLEKVLDGLDAWVLAHEDGTLTEAWSSSSLGRLAKNGM